MDNGRITLVYLVDYAEKGYMTATVSYRLDTLIQRCVEDIADAVDWIFKMAELTEWILRGLP